MESSAKTEQWILTGGKANSSTISVFLMARASSTVRPLIHSVATEWIKGRTVDEALAIKNTEIVEELALPPVKIHCSVLAEDSIRTAINDWKKKNGHEVEDDHHHH